VPHIEAKGDSFLGFRQTRFLRISGFPPSRIQSQLRLNLTCAEAIVYELR